MPLRPRRRSPATRRASSPAPSTRRRSRGSRRSRAHPSSGPCRRLRDVPRPRTQPRQSPLRLAYPTRRCPRSCSPTARWWASSRPGRACCATTRAGGMWRWTIATRSPATSSTSIAETGRARPCMWRFWRSGTSRARRFPARCSRSMTSSWRRSIARERNYDRCDVSEFVELDGRVWAYVGSAAGRARCVAGRAAGTAVISAEYLASVPDAEPPDLPVRPLLRRDVGARQPAVDQERRRGDVARLVGGEEQRARWRSRAPRAKRPIGRCTSRRAAFSGSLANSSCSSGVSTGPGHSALTRTPARPNSTPSSRDIASTAALGRRVGDLRRRRAHHRDERRGVDHRAAAGRRAGAGCRACSTGRPT